MASGTRGRPRRVQGRVSEPTGSTPSRSPSPFGGPDDLAGTQAPPPGPSNVLAVAPRPPDALAAAPAGSEAPPRVYSYEEMQDIIRTMMEAKPATTEGPQERPLKARLPDVYRGDNHMACYNFCQQCKDHFATAGAKRPNRISFAASFLQDCISFRWQQHKQKLDNETLVPPTWEEFKAFLHKSLGDSRTFVDKFLVSNQTRRPISTGGRYGLGRTPGTSPGRAKRV